MLRRIILSALIVTLAKPAFAGDLLASAKKEAEALAAEQSAQSAPSPASRNALLWPGVALLGGGVGLALYGFKTVTGPETMAEVTDLSITSGNINNHATGAGVGILGVGLAAAGAVLFSKGIRRAPSVQVGSGRLSVQKRISF